MSINRRLSSSSNVFDQTVDYVADYGAVAGGSTATNNAALSAFNTAYAGFTGHTRLTIPPGTYAHSGDAWWGILGGDRLTIAAPGVTIAGIGGTAKIALYDDDQHHANIATVSAGASTVSLITSGQTSRFSVGQGVLVTEGDLQGFGSPPNPWKFEFKRVASIGSGTLTFTEPLTNSYSSTFPNYGAGGAFQPYLGGPATVYALSDAWDQEIEIQGMTFADSGGLFYGKTRIAKYTDCIFETYGPCPTMNVLFRTLRCSTLSLGTEVDKIVQRMEVIDSTPYAVDFQSSSINELYVTGTTASGYWRGVAGGTTYINGLDTPEFRFGVAAYGAVTGHTELVNCNSANATFSPGYAVDLSDYTEEGEGVISITGGPATWAVPGAYFYLAEGTDPNAFAASYQVTDVTKSGGTTYIATTLPDPIPATINGKNAPFQLRPHPGPNVTCVTCTGSTLFTNQSALPANSPLFGWTL